MLNVWTGDGKGKSTSAFGLTMRAWGQGFNILIIQFLKGAEACEYGEIKTCLELNKIRPNSIKVIQSGSNKIVLEKNKTNKDKEEAESAFALMNLETSLNKYDLIIIDELLPVLQLDLLDFDLAYKWLKEKKKENLEIVITGRMSDKIKTRKIKDISELYSKIVCINHPFNTKCPDCLIEYNFRYHYCPECGKELITGKKARLGLEF